MKRAVSDFKLEIVTLAAQGKAAALRQDGVLAGWLQFQSGNMKTADTDAAETHKRAHRMATTAIAATTVNERLTIPSYLERRH